MEYLLSFWAEQQTVYHNKPAVDSDERIFFAWRHQEEVQWWERHRIQSRFRMLYVVQAVN